MLNNKRGMAMLVVMGIVFMLLILGAAATMISIGHGGTSYHQIVRVRAYYAAEAGLQHALWQCRSGGYNLAAGDSETITITDPNYTLDVDITVDPPDAIGNLISVEVDY